MKKKFFLAAIFCLLLILTTCDSNQKVERQILPSTDLSSVNIDGIVVGASIHDVDLAKYTPLPSGTFKLRKNSYDFEELRIETDARGTIQKITGNVYGYIDGNKGVSFSIKDTNNPSSISIVTEILGQYHNDYWFDREQRIKAYTFYDVSNKIYATFTFDYNSSDLVWVILSK